jgi:uncharacterized protein (TIGR00290 family)
MSQRMNKPVRHRPTGSSLPLLFCWSGGKDSALALSELLRGGYEIAALLTTVTEGYDRISMHGVRTALLEEQASSLALPLEKVRISKDISSNKEYEEKLGCVLKKYRDRGVESVAFGDIFLEDLRIYREAELKKVGLKGLFPIWKVCTAELAERFIREGFRAVVTCVDSTKLNGRFAGREFDRGFLSTLPAGVDPCGERGEFHTFVFDGPIFNRCVGFKKGEVVLREERFYYCDLLPVDTGFQAE